MIAETPKCVHVFVCHFTFNACFLCGQVEGQPEGKTRYTVLTDYLLMINRAQKEPDELQAEEG